MNMIYSEIISDIVKSMNCSADALTEIVHGVIRDAHIEVVRSISYTAKGIMEKLNAIDLLAQTEEARRELK